MDFREDSYSQRMLDNFGSPAGADYEHEAERAGARRATRILAALLGIFLAAAVVIANASEVFRAGDQNGRPMSLRLLDEPCSPEVVKWLPTRVQPQFHAAMRAAILNWGGRDWKACWIDVDGDVYSLDEEGVMLNGGQGTPRRLFRDDSV